MTIRFQRTKYYYTMREVCNILDVKSHVLRFWETQFTQLNPQRKRRLEQTLYAKGYSAPQEKFNTCSMKKKFKIKGAKKSAAKC